MSCTRAPPGGRGRPAPRRGRRPRGACACSLRTSAPPLPPPRPSASRWARSPTAWSSSVGELPLLILTSGAHRVDERKVADLLGVERIARPRPSSSAGTPARPSAASPRSATPSRSAPSSTSSSPATSTVWAAAGHPAAVFPTSYDELLRLTDGHPRRGRHPARRRSRPTTPGGGRLMTGTKPDHPRHRAAHRLAARPHARGPDHLRPGHGLRRRGRRRPLRLRHPAHRPARLPRRRRLRRDAGRRAARRLRLRLPRRARASGGTTRSAPPSTGGRRSAGCPARSRSASCTSTPSTRARAWAGGCCTPWSPACRTRRPCSPPRTPTRRRSGSTTPTASSTWPAATTSPATRGPSPSSASAAAASARPRPANTERALLRSSDGRVDVVVVGSGHNGLVAACYLARAGLSVEVVESDDVLGGAVSTVERWPGVRVDRGSSAHVIIRQSGIVEELDLAAHGLRYLDCDPWGFAPAPSPRRRRSRRPAAGLLGRPRRDLRLDRRRLRPRGRRRLPPVRRGLGSAQPGGRRLVRPARPARPGWSARSGRWAPRGTGSPAPPAATSPSTSSAPATPCSTAGSPASGSRPRWPGSAPSPARRCPNPAPRPWSAGWRCCTTSRPATRSAARAG